ncbi:TIGR04282 family arsenosugar biosynthesis glycosyltransferase [soil metagenome]
MTVSCSKPAILIMTKVPKPGMVKTRLRPFLSDDQCSELSKCFLTDTIDKCLMVTPNVIVAYAAHGDEGSIFDLLPETVTCIKQNGKDLGERLVSAIDFAEANNCGPILVIGTDSPTIPLKAIRTAFRHLDSPETQMVLCGTEDGGYCLLGLKKNVPAIFQDIPWSSERVYSTTLKRADQAGLTGIVELLQWYDVDTPNDLRRLYDEVEGGAHVSAIVPNTARWIAANRNLFS